MQNEAGIVGAAVAALYRQRETDDAAAAQTEQDTAQDLSQDDTAS
jgi:hypothetical protein